MSDDIERLRALADSGDTDALHALARHHRRAGSLPEFLASRTPPRTSFGTFTEVAAITGSLPTLAGPSRRFLTLVRGTSTLAVHDTLAEGLPEIARFRRLDSLFFALHPSGRRILTLNRDGTRLNLRDLDSGDACGRWMHRPPNWDGRPLKVGEAPDAWGYASEAITFTHDGHILYAGYDVESRATLYLLDGSTLDTLDTLQVEAPTLSGPPEPLTTWCEHIGFTSAPDGRQLLVLNGGDSFIAAFAFGVKDGRITQHAAFGDVLWAHFGHTHSVTPSQDGRLLYIMDSDRVFHVVSWPECQLEFSMSPLKPWRTDGFDLELFREDGSERNNDLLVSDILTLTEDHIVFTVVDYFTYATYGFAVLDAATLLPLGVETIPRMRGDAFDPLGSRSGLFADIGRKTTRIWRYGAR